LNAKKTEAAIDRILHLDELPDVRTLAQQLYN
jgi:hypothetical protein